MLACGGCRRFLRSEDGACPFCGAARPTAFAPIAMTIALGVTLGACGPTVAVDDGSTSTGTMTTASTVSTTTMMPTPVDTGTSVPPDPSLPTSASGTDTADTTTSSADDDVTADGGCAFYGCPPDGGNLDIQCDIWAQDCPEGDKCSPWASDGGTRWNGTRCSPFDPDGGAPGDACVAEGSKVSGLDDCGHDSMCWNVDVDTNQGVCVAICSGSEANPTCLGDADLQCMIAYEGVIHVCLPQCDPLVQDCANGWECAPYDGQGFFCVPDNSERGGALGEGCDDFDDCNVGLHCAPPEQVPGCVDFGCCAELCDLDQPEPDTQCSGVDDGVQCIAWPDAVMPNLGACALPG